MDYSYFVPPAQPYQFFGLPPSKPEHPFTPQDEPQNNPLDVYIDPNPFQYFDPASNFSTTTVIPTPHSPPNSIPYDGSRSLSQEVINDADFDQAPGRGSSDDDKDNLTPAQSRRKAQNRAAQRAFRERKERRVKDLEIKLKSMEAHSTDLLTDNERLKREIDRIATQNEILRATSTPMRALQQDSGHDLHAENASSPEAGPPIYSPSTFNAAFSVIQASGNDEPMSHRIAISTTGERLLAMGAAWELIQSHETYRKGIVDLGEVVDRLKERVVCDGAGPTFAESDVLRAIEESVGTVGDELI